MTLRDKLRQNSKAVIIIFSVLIVTCGIYLLVQLFSNTDDSRIIGKAFFTVDDGKTTFVASADNMPPFDQDGQTAIRAIVFSCDAGKTRFIGYVQRLTPLGKEKMTAIRERQKKSKTFPSLDPELSANIEIKRPGDKLWVKQSNVEQARKIMNVRCPQDPSVSAEPVQP